jgi:hypothetical protein
MTDSNQHTESPGEESPGTLEYIGTPQELAEAGGGFSIRHIDRMPEHESEFVPAPGMHSGGVDEDLARSQRERRAAS